MKILKIFGIVVGIHVFALILIFANPGCSSTSKPSPKPADTVASTQPAPSITMPSFASQSGSTAMNDVAVTPATGGFNPDAPATYAGTDSAGRYSPTRPNTPAASAVLSQPVPDVMPATTYVVKSGDSLWSLQKRFHVPLREIAAANNLRISTPLHVGQKLIIPTTSAAHSATAAKSPAAHGAPAASPHPAKSAARPAGQEIKYTVKSGETLGAIAHKFDVKVRDLALRNNITDPRNLRAGTELVIPGWHAPGSAKSKTAPAEPESTPSATTSTATPAQQPPPNLLEPSPSEPTQTPTTSVPVIDIDQTPVTPAPKS